MSYQKHIAMTKIECPSKFKTFLKLMAVLAGLGGFLWLCLGQMEKFLSGMTAVTVGWHKVESFQLPTIVFCNQQPYHDGDISLLMSKNEYDQMATVVDVNFTEITSWISSDETKNPPKIYDIYTRFNGKCKAFTFYDDFKARDYLCFNAKNDMEVFFILPGEEFYLVDQNWGRDSMTLSSTDKRPKHIMFEMFEEWHEKKTQCQPGATSLDKLMCIKEKLDKIISESGSKCLYPQQEPYILENKKMPYCENRTEINIMNKISQVISDEHLKQLCPIPCSQKKIDIRKTQLANVNPNFSSTAIAEPYGVFMIYPSNEVIKYDEYYIYDINGIVASVGGGLGLFLGFSCLTMISKAIDTLTDLGKK